MKENDEKENDESENEKVISYIFLNIFYKKFQKILKTTFC